jgi:small subunit ribosomal protein S7
MERDKEFRDKAPEILKKDKSEPPKPEGTSQASASEPAENVTFDNLLALGKLEHVSNGGHASEVTNPGYKFKLPDLPLPPGMNQKSRYDPIIEQVTKLLMKDGKLSKAQTVSLPLQPLRLNFSLPLGHSRQSGGQ